MRVIRGLVAAFALCLVCALAACAPPPPEPEPFAVNATDVQGDTVTVELDQVLYINTSDLDFDVESFDAEIEDESIVEFMPGQNAGDFATYPGFTPLNAGSTKVTMTAADDDIPPLEFTIEVVAPQS